jgi:hypothetical protein
MKLMLASAVALIAIASAVILMPAKDAKAEGAVVGQAAPEFTGTDSNGVSHKLSDFKGKTVVLEWTNPECPYVVKHYSVGNMQKIQSDATKDGVVWISINSSAEGKEGNQTPADANAYMKEQKSTPTARILDPTGTIGKLYGAKTTPHMFIVNPEGILVYAGAIDDNDSFKSDVIATSKNHVTAALKNLKDGKAVETASTKPYGCGVKY